MEKPIIEFCDEWGVRTKKILKVVTESCNKDQLENVNCLIESAYKEGLKDGLKLINWLE